MRMRAPSARSTVLRMSFSGASLPPAIISAIKGLPPGPVRPSFGEEDRMRDICVFANEICDLFQGRSVDGVNTSLLALLDKYAETLPCDEDYALKLIYAGFEKLKAFSPVFEVDVSRSEYCRSVSSWLDARIPADDDVRRSA